MLPVNSATKALPRQRCRRKNTIELHSANRAYPPLVFYGQDRKKVKIFGKHVGLIRKE